MKDNYIIVYEDENRWTEAVDISEVESIIIHLIRDGYGYDDIRLFKAKELDFTVDILNAKVKVKDE